VQGQNARRLFLAFSSSKIISLYIRIYSKKPNIRNMNNNIDIYIHIHMCKLRLNHHSGVLNVLNYAFIIVIYENFFFFLLLPVESITQFKLT